ncbi:hypothetical protein QP028_01690 [Corynebacterium suedekumii]|uniref:Integral membrane protein n=1 Tax=Corynebacterium suedekumii TaxID=3049801 RepID=A0ABY8VJ90_9CORY|nr:hypothetical protein [Corynebacterium suedekumii]WIM69417.1 hypothetical protein QP029_09135 [Corynebacterium suedekumii]WIM72674.1 hypothetical protein QP028_01690 [Corynebacterium suedekumii]
MNRPIIRTDFSRGEAVGGLVWLSVAAAISVLLEVVYLGTWITLPDGARLAVPYTIPVAFLFNIVLTRTARLWTPNSLVALIPLYVWTGGFLLLMFGVVLTGDQLVASSIRSVGLLVAGLAGGVWPVLRAK